LARPDVLRRSRIPSGVSAGPAMTQQDTQPLKASTQPFAEKHQ